MPKEQSPWKPTTRRYSPEEKAAPVRTVRTELGTERGTVQRVAQQLGAWHRVGAAVGTPSRHRRKSCACAAGSVSQGVHTTATQLRENYFHRRHAHCAGHSVRASAAGPLRRPGIVSTGTGPPAAPTAYGHIAFGAARAAASPIGWPSSKPWSSWPHVASVDLAAVDPWRETRPPQWRAFIPSNGATVRASRSD